MLLSLLAYCPPSMERLAREHFPERVRERVERVEKLRDSILRLPFERRKAMVEAHMAEPLPLSRELVDSLAVMVGIARSLGNVVVSIRDSGWASAFYRGRGRPGDSIFIYLPYLMGIMEEWREAVREGRLAELRESYGEKGYRARHIITYITLHELFHHFDYQLYHSTWESTATLALCYVSEGPSATYADFVDGYDKEGRALSILLAPFIRGYPKPKGDMPITLIALGPGPEVEADGVMKLITDDSLWVEREKVWRMVAGVFKIARDRREVLLLLWWNAKMLAEELGLPYDVPKPTLSTRRD